MSKTLSIVIPCYNEERTILPLLEAVRAVDLGSISKEIIIVDDGSTDSTRDLLAKLDDNYVVFLSPVNKGKGAAVRKGFSLATGDIVIVQDADLEYDPNDYSALIKPIISGEYKVVYGSRILNKSNKKHAGIKFYIGGRFLTFLTNLLYGSKLTDEPTCYKVFDRKLLMSIPLNCDGFEFCPEITSKLLKRKIAIKELPISYSPRSIDEGKKINWVDGIIAIWTLIKFRVRK